MLDIRLIRNNPQLVKDNIKKKFQDDKTELVDKVIGLDARLRECMAEADNLRAKRNTVSKQIGGLMAQGKKDEAQAAKAEVSAIGPRITELEQLENTLQAEIRQIMLVIPNIIDDTVPIGRDDSENVEAGRFGEAYKPEFEIPYHVDIMERLSGIDLESARKTSGSG
ncbi:MAG: serine--tRNA ligase, partial [Oscillospiraceae bacterium]|nr:serine--tRNA ligase [Oscillospiraceae bacterium]